MTFLVLLLHSGMDFDWAYPGLLSLAALVAVLCLPRPDPVPPPSQGRALALASVSVLLLLVSAAGAWQGGLDLNASVALPALR